MPRGTFPSLACANGVFPELVKAGFQSTIIFSPPGYGKTTLLRDLIRKLSTSGFRVAVADERGEISGINRRQIGFDLGPNTDVMTGGRKAETAIYTPGAAFLNMMTPCPRGWRYETSEIMEICRLAVETCYWPLFEVAGGKWILNYEPKKKLPIEDFLKPQGRFKHLFKPGNEHLIELFQQEVDKRWEDLQYRCARER